MNSENRLQRRGEAAAQFDQHEQRSDGARIAGNLADGLYLLCELFYTRIHVDVEKNFGMDSMLVPVSPVKTEEKAKIEISLYEIVESAGEVQNHKYVQSADGWYLDWLAQLQLGEIAQTPVAQQRLGQYAGKPHQERRRIFANTLQRTLPEAARAPLLVYRLLPMAAAIATSVAFGDHTSAQEVRKRQIALLPGIGDCQQCHGNVLENGERCSLCANPLWKYEWLTAE